MHNNKLVTVALLVFTSLNGVRSQTTAAILPAVSGIDGVQGEIVGSGADGTTYVISGSVSGVAATVTLVEDATHFSEFAEAATSSVTLKINEECEYNSQHEGSCTGVAELDLSGISTATTTVASATISFQPIALTTKSSGVSINHVMAVPIIATAMSGLALLLAAL